MQKTMPVEPISIMKQRPHNVLRKLEAGPVLLSVRGKGAAVMTSIEEWNQIADELHRYRVIAEAKRIAARNDANETWTSGAEMRRIMAERGVHVED
jgi:prevent-host-death family protein